MLKDKNDAIISIKKVIIVEIKRSLEKYGEKFFIIFFKINTIVLIVTGVITIISTTFLDGYVLNGNSYEKLDKYIILFQKLNKEFDGKTFKTEREIKNKLNEITSDNNLIDFLIRSRKVNYNITSGKYELENFYIPSEKERIKLLKFKNIGYSNRRTLEIDIETELENSKFLPLINYIIAYDEKEKYNLKFDDKSSYVYVLNDDSFKKLEILFLQLDIINKTFKNKKFETEKELILELKKEIPLDFFSNYELLILKNIYQEKSDYYYKLDKLYIPTQEDKKELLKIKNKRYKSIDEVIYTVNKTGYEGQLDGVLSEILNRESDFFYYSKKIAIGAFFVEMFIFLLVVILALLFEEEKTEIEEQQLTEKKEKIKKLEEENPEKIKPVWDFAATELKEQMQIIRKQASNIYKISVIAIGMGFLGLLASIYYMLTKESSNITLLATIASILTEFIGGTLMILYKTTILQLNENLKILERFNFVGMGIKILDTLDETKDNSTSNETKCEIVKKLMEKI